MNDRINTIFGWVLFARASLRWACRCVSGIISMPTSRNARNSLAMSIAGRGRERRRSRPVAGHAARHRRCRGGRSVFAKCTACHTIASGGADGIGPNLFGVMGKPIGSACRRLCLFGSSFRPWRRLDLREYRRLAEEPARLCRWHQDELRRAVRAQERANLILYLLANGGGPALPRTG